MIIIEGSDLVGKTTLAQRLLREDELQQQGFIYKHLSRLPYGFKPHMYQEHAHMRSVQDRFHMSEPVYAAVRGDTTFLTPEKYRRVDGYLRQLGAITIVLTAEESLIRSRMREGEMYNIKQILLANSMFNTIGILGGKWQDYNMDVDFHFILTKDYPSISNESIKHIVNFAKARNHEDYLRGQTCD
jgi:GTPase SAR1 family protein